MRVLALWLVFASCPHLAEAKRGDVKAAAQQFARGKSLYDQGKFAEAIAAYRKAQQIAPHPSTLFNIARCYENLGDQASALRHYQQALKLSPALALRRSIEQRIAGIRALPVKIFVSTVPPGASVTVDGRSQPEARATPTVLRLAPGEHVLLLRKAGHLLAAKRVEVAVGKEQALQLTLERRPQAKPCPPPRCPRCLRFPRCRPTQLTNFSRLHLNVEANATFLLAKGWGMVSGIGTRLQASYGRLFFAGLFNYLPVGNDANPQDAERTKLVVMQLGGGWIFPFRNFWVYASGAAGFYWDSLSIVREGQPTSATETFGFNWALGGGIQALIIRWLAIDIGLRAGMLHGKRLDLDPEQNRTFDGGRVFPYVSVWGGLAFHI